MGAACGQQNLSRAVEDEALVSMLIEDMLDELGVHVVGPVSNIDAALSVARSAELEAGILDVNVGGQVSYAVAEVLRERDIPVPVIFATGYSASALPARFYNAPVLHKPFGREDFEKVLQAALANAPCEIRPN